MKTGKVKWVANQTRKFGSNLNYAHVRVNNGGQIESWLLTKADVELVRSRAMANPEDCPPPRLTLFEKICRWIGV